MAGEAGFGEARHGKACRGVARHGNSWQAGLGWARRGQAWPGKSRQAHKKTKQAEAMAVSLRPVTQAAKEDLQMAFAKKTEGVAVIAPANIVATTIKIVGTSPLVQNKFSKKAREKMMSDMSTKASEKKAKSARPPRNYDDDFIQCQHIAVAGWHGVPAAAFRAAAIDACRTINLVMTKAKMSIFVMPDGFDADDGTPLVKINSAKPPERIESLVRNDNGGADIRIRAMWREWSADVAIEFDADMITPESVVNLLDRAGRQVGIGEGRPFSKNSVGQNWGTFTVVENKPEEKRV